MRSGWELVQENGGLISFEVDTEEIQPAEGAVSISIEFTNNQLTNELAVSSEEDITVVHLPIKAEVKEQSEITSTVEATEISSEDIEVKTLTDATAEITETEKVEFSEDSFSVYAVIMNNNAMLAALAAEVKEYDYVSSFGDAYDYGVVANVYPNPTKGTVTIEAEGIISVRLINMMGQVLDWHEYDRSNSVTLNLNGYTPSVYLLEIKTVEGMVKKRVMVSR